MKEKEIIIKKLNESKKQRIKEANIDGVNNKLDSNFMPIIIIVVLLIILIIYKILDWSP